ncbi:hypothetical protein D3C72_1876730 [compost metagenome]
MLEEAAQHFPGNNGSRSNQLQRKHHHVDEHSRHTEDKEEHLSEIHKCQQDQEVK